LKSIRSVPSGRSARCARVFTCNCFTGGNESAHETRAASSRGETSRAVVSRPAPSPAPVHAVAAVVVVVVDITTNAKTATNTDFCKTISANENARLILPTPLWPYGRCCWTCRFVDFAASFRGGRAKVRFPEAALAALTDAAKARDTNAVRAIFGPEGHE